MRKHETFSSLTEIIQRKLLYTPYRVFIGTNGRLKNCKLAILDYIFKVFAIRTRRGLNFFSYNNGLVRAVLSKTESLVWNLGTNPSGSDIIILLVYISMWNTRVLNYTSYIRNNARRKHLLDIVCREKMATKLVRRILSFIRSSLLRNGFHYINMFFEKFINPTRPQLCKWLWTLNGRELIVTRWTRVCLFQNITPILVIFPNPVAINCARRLHNYDDAILPDFPIWKDGISPVTRLAIKGGTNFNREPVLSEGNFFENVLCPSTDKDLKKFSTSIFSPNNEATWKIFRYHLLIVRRFEKFQRNGFATTS